MVDENVEQVEEEAAAPEPVERTLRVLNVKVTDKDTVTAPAEHETAVHPEGREDDQGNDLSGQEYQEVVTPERRGTRIWTITLEAEGFTESTRAQVDISTGDGYREYATVDVPASDKPEKVTVKFGPAPHHLALGAATIFAFEVDASGTLVGDSKVNDQGLQSWAPLVRHDA